MLVFVHTPIYIDIHVGLNIVSDYDFMNTVFCPGLFENFVELLGHFYS